MAALTSNSIDCRGREDARVGRVGGASPGRRVDQTQPVYQFQSLEQSLSESVAPRRFNMFLLEVYAGAGAIMALVGTFGVVAHSVSRRTRETACALPLAPGPLLSCS